jgi:hypothetical protein
LRVREKPVQMVIVELREKLTRRLVRGQVQQAHSVEMDAGCQKADWRPPLLGLQQPQATPRVALFALAALRSGRLARASFAPGQRL